MRTFLVVGSLVSVLALVPTVAWAQRSSNAPKSSKSIFNTLNKDQRTKLVELRLRTWSILQDAKFATATSDVAFGARSIANEVGKYVSTKASTEVSKRDNSAKRAHGKLVKTTQRLREDLRTTASEYKTVDIRLNQALLRAASFVEKASIRHKKLEDFFGPNSVFQSEPLESPVFHMDEAHDIMKLLTNESETSN